MRHYRRNYSGNDRVKKVMFRILFVLIAAAVITFGSIILGNYLLRKVAQMNAELEAENVAEEALSIALKNVHETRHELNAAMKKGTFVEQPANDVVNQ